MCCFWTISTEVQEAPIGFCYSRPSLGYFGDDFFLKLELILSKDKIRVLILPPKALEKEARF